MTRRRLLGSLLLAVPLLAAVAAPAAADPPVGKAALPAWNVAATKTPATVEELRALEAATKAVVAKCTPVTVGIEIDMGLSKAAGSGVIVSEDGLVLTAAHVSGEPNKACTVILADGTRVKAKTLGTNERIDSGMIRLTDGSKAPNKDGKWPFAVIGKSGDLKKDQWVVTLGHHGGWRTGRPAVARLGQVIDSQKDLIRSSCMLVGGDSGGPLFDLDGKVVGIHSRIGFTLAHNIHVPVDGFKAEWAQLVAGEPIGKTPKGPAPYFGASFVDDAGNEVKGAKGLKVTLLPDGSPAAKAGLKLDDELVSFDGTDVETVDEFRRLLRRRKPGDEVDVVVYRDGRRQTVTVALARQP